MKKKRLSHAISGLMVVLVILLFTPKNGWGQGGYSSMAIWVEDGMWIGGGAGVVSPMGRSMNAYHDGGFNWFGSLEFPWTFFTYGIEGGIQMFGETALYPETFIYPFNLYVNTSLLSLYSNQARRNKDLKKLNIQTGLGGGIYIMETARERELYQGLYIPLILSYQWSLVRMNLELKGHEVFGQISTGTTTSEYASVNLSVELFVPF